MTAEKLLLILFYLRMLTAEIVQQPGLHTKLGLGFRVKAEHDHRFLFQWAGLLQSCFSHSLVSMDVRGLLLNSHRHSVMNLQQTELL